MRVIVRMWTAAGYHKDVALLSEQQVHMVHMGMEATSSKYLVHPIDAVRIVIDPKDFSDAVEFEVIVQR